MLYLGNNLDVLKSFDENSVDAIVTDPPYGLSFMGKAWDYDVPKCELWREVLRVLKPGGYMLAFFGTRTYHRGVVAIEDAGFEIRDQLQWIYGSGFPKSLNIGKAIDKAAGAEREVVGMRESPYTSTARNESESIGKHKVAVGENGYELHPVTAPATDAAKLWDGWGTALKPANEPIVLARKPLSEKTVAANVLRWGTGAINVDESRIGYEAKDLEIVKAAIKRLEKSNNQNNVDKGVFQASKQLVPNDPSKGRWPANVLFDESAAEMLDAQSGTLKSGARKQSVKANSGVTFQAGGVSPCDSSSGGASRFFYVAKASKSERNRGLEGMPKQLAGAISGKETRPDRPPNHTMRENFHPTVKPVKLMQYLIKLITPPKGIVLDPFMGSGSTGVAATALGFKFIGIELNQDYFDIANKRISNEKLV